MPTPTNQPTPSRLRVLIVEDSAAIQQELEAILRNLGHEVVGKAYHARAAVELATKLKPDVMLLDLVMPDPDTGGEDRTAGLTATESILRQAPTAIIWLTAHENGELIQEASRLGVSAYLVKPAAASELALRLQ